jgi:hypothetical protein
MKRYAYTDLLGEVYGQNPDLAAKLIGIGTKIPAYEVSDFAAQSRKGLENLGLSSSEIGFLEGVLEDKYSLKLGTKAKPKKTTQRRPARRSRSAAGAPPRSLLERVHGERDLGLFRQGPIYD